MLKRFFIILPLLSLSGCDPSSTPGPSPAASSATPLGTLGSAPSPSPAVEAPKGAANVSIPRAISQLMAQIPPDIGALDPEAPNPTPNQWNFNIFAWFQFIALNWPVHIPTCRPNVEASITGESSSLRVWQRYLQDFDLLMGPGQRLSPGDRPSAWCPSDGEAQLLSKLSKLPKNTAKDALAFAKKYKPSHAFLRSSKAGGTRSDLPGIEEAVDGVLTDQNGRFVRYEVMVNKDEYDFIMQPDSDPENHLWSVQGQNAYFQKNPSIKMLSMPSGRAGGPVGAMEIKAAWKVLNEAEIAGNRYFMLKDAMLHTGGAGFQKATMGLVGMHIVHKTVTAPQWVWSTFEHVDNILSPTGGGGAFNNAKCAQTPVYSDPSPAVPCTGECCAPNTQTASRDKNGAYNELDAQGKAIHRPVQVLRAQKSGDRELNQINEEFQRLLAGTVWANYKLIGTQWPSEPLKNGKAKPPSMDVKPEPKVLANVVFETFNQGPEEPQDTTPPYPYSLEKGSPSPFSAAVSSSCIGCHSVATTAGGPDGAKFSNYADFSMILGNAQELPEAKGAKKAGPAK